MPTQCRPILKSLPHITQTNTLPEREMWEGETGQNFGGEGHEQIGFGKGTETSMHETNCAMALEQRKTLTKIKILEQQHCLYKLQGAKT